VRVFAIAARAASVLMVQACCVPLTGCRGGAGARPLRRASDVVVRGRSNCCRTSAGAGHWRRVFSSDTWRAGVLRGFAAEWYVLLATMGHPRGHAGCRSPLVAQCSPYFLPSPVTYMLPLCWRMPPSFFMLLMPAPICWTVLLRRAYLERGVPCLWTLWSTAY